MMCWEAKCVRFLACGHAVDERGRLVLGELGSYAYTASSPGAFGVLWGPGAGVN
jgi:hypothetical protein